MLKDITIGQYFNSGSIIHKLDPRIKIIIMILYVFMVFMVKSFEGLLIPLIYIFSLYIVAKIPFRLVLKSLKPMVPIIIFTGIINMMFIDGEVLASFWIFRITREGLVLSFIMIVRVIALVIGTSLLTYTTSPIELTDAIERLLKPLKKIKVPVHELAMMMTIALRFIPTLIEETDKIMSAQKARGADIETGSLTERAKAMIPILIPLFVSSFRRADDLAMAMECRCYRGDYGRTRMKQLKLSFKDFVSITISIIFFVFVIYSNNFFVAVF